MSWFGFCRSPGMREGGGPGPARDGSAASHLEGLTLFMYADHLLPLVGEMLPQPGPKDNKPFGWAFGPQSWGPLVAGPPASDRPQDRGWWPGAAAEPARLSEPSWSVSIGAMAAKAPGSKEGSE